MIEKIMLSCRGLILTTGLAALALGFNSCSKDFEHLHGKYGSLNVIIERSIHDSGKSYRYILLTREEPIFVRGMERLILQDIRAVDSNHNGLFEEDEIEVDSFTLKQAKEYREKGYRDFMGILEYAKPDSLEKIYYLITRDRQPAIH
jgi:hypothetical protein